MAKKRKKPIRKKGKISLSRYFQELKEGQRVVVIEEPSIKFGFPRRIHGKVGTVEGKRGKAYIIKIKDQNKEKKYIIAPIHLKKINS